MKKLVYHYPCHQHTGATTLRDGKIIKSPCPHFQKALDFLDIYPEANVCNCILSALTIIKGIHHLQNDTGLNYMEIDSISPTYEQSTNPKYRCRIILSRGGRIGDYTLIIMT